MLTTKLFLLFIALYTANSYLITWEADMMTTVAGTVIYNDGTTGYSTLPYDTHVCGIGNQIVYINDGNGGCHGEESFFFERGSVNIIRSNGTSHALGRPVTVVENGYFTTYPEGHRTGLPFAVAKGDWKTSLPIVVTGTPEHVNKGNGNLFKLYKFKYGDHARITDGYFCHSATGKCVKEVRPSAVEYYYLATGAGQNWLELGVDIPDLPGRYMPDAGLQLERIIVGVTPETNIKLRLPYEPYLESGRAKRSAIALSIYSNALVFMHKNDVREGLKIADQNANDLGKTLKRVINIQSDTLRREKAIEIMDGVVMEESAVNNYLHRGLATIANAIHSIVNGLTGYLLEMTHLNEESIYAHELLRQEYRVNLTTNNSKVISDTIVGNRYYATVQMDGSLVSGRGAPKCDKGVCIIPGNWYHYQRKGLVELVDGVVLTTISCGVYIDYNLTDYDRGIIEGTSDFHTVISILETRKYKYMWVTNATCGEGTLSLRNSRISELQVKAITFLGATIENVRDGFKFNCPKNVTTVSMEAELITSYACERVHRIENLDAVINDLDSLEVKNSNAYGAFNEATKRGWGNLLSTMSEESINGLVDIGKNFKAFEEITEGHDFDQMENEMKIALGISISSLAFAIFGVVVNLCIYQRLKKGRSTVSRDGQDTF